MLLSHPLKMLAFKVIAQCFAFFSNVFILCNSCFGDGPQDYAIWAVAVPGSCGRTPMVIVCGVSVYDILCAVRLANYVWTAFSPSR